MAAVDMMTRDPRSEPYPYPKMRGKDWLIVLGIVAACIVAVALFLWALM